MDLSTSSSSSSFRADEYDIQLYLWQKATFTDDGTGRRDTADSIRLRLAQLQSNYNKDSMHESMVGEYLQTYSEVMDHRDESKGMNNFYSPVQVLTSGQRKECTLWKSGLLYENVIEMPEFKSLLTQQRMIKQTKTHKSQNCVAFSSFSSHESKAVNQTTAAAVDARYVVRSSTSSTNEVITSHKAGQPIRTSSSGFSYPASNKFANQDGVCAPSRPLRTNPQHRNSFRNMHVAAQPPSVKRMRMMGSEADECEESSSRPSAFITARDQYVINQHKQGRGKGGNTNPNNYGTCKKSLGTRRTASSRFVPPVKRGMEEDGEGINEEVRSRVLYGNSSSGGSSKSFSGGLPPELEGDERLKNIEPKMVELIMNEIMDHGAPVQWDDIAGLHFAKATIKEIVVWPMMRPDIFKGLRGPPKGILLFGPPGTGKTLIGKCIASQVNATFFSISASSLTSKWVGEGEKMVRALFAVARCYQPAVIFIDEIDSLLSQRSDTEHESSRRIKTEFLVQLDGATSSDEDKLLLIGATNRPQEIDEAARRRLVKRLYIPLPDFDARKQIVTNLMKQQPYSFGAEELEDICAKTEGYSGADMANLCREAAYGPVREAADTIQHIAADEMRPIHYKDFESAILVVRPSVSDKDLGLYVEWNKQFGCSKGR